MEKVFPLEMLQSSRRVQSAGAVIWEIKNYFSKLAEGLKVKVSIFRIAHRLRRALFLHAQPETNNSSDAKELPLPLRSSSSSEFPDLIKTRH